MKQGHTNCGDRADLQFCFDGKIYGGKSGDSLAAALLRAGVYALGATSDRKAQRGAFCWMGWCQECRVWHEGQLVEACRLIVVDGLEVRSRGYADAD